MELYTVELGNSDRIRLKFGSYGIEVIESGERIRVSHLYSEDEGKKTVRTFAVVALPQVIQPEFSKEHEQITNGQSIGIVFKNNGWVIDKRHQYFGSMHDLPDSRLIFGETGSVDPVIHVYSLFISKPDMEFLYASIAEVHHPDYLTLADMKVIYGDKYRETSIKDGQLEAILQIVKSRMAKA